MTPSNVLLLDIETAPGEAYVWSLFDENIPLERLIAPSRVLCWSAAWYKKPGMYYADERAGAAPMLAQLATMLGEADAVVTYNGDKFDLPKVMGGFVRYCIDPPPPIPSIDLYKTVRKLGYQSSKLAFVAPYLGIGEKIKHAGFELWRECMAGNEKAWAKMERYNRQDVRLLGRLYEVLLPYIKTHPYLGKIVGARPACPRCNSRKIQSRGYRRTKAFVIQRIQCLGCGGWHDGAREKVKYA